MKTTNNVQKTENRNSEKLNMKTLVVIISFALFSFTSSAAVLFNHAETNNSEKSAILNTSHEKSLEIESWMIDANNFGTQMSEFEVVEIDQPMEIEDWMLTNQNFLETKNNIESDSSLEMEDWMLDTSKWSN